MSVCTGCGTRKDVTYSGYFRRALCPWCWRTAVAGLSGNSALILELDGAELQGRLL